ncbi:MAG: ribosome-associated translation inhibitor RaiA [Pseudomonadota bacterium]
MRIQVNGKQIDVGDALRTHVTTRLSEVVDKFAIPPVEAQVTFSRDAHQFVADTSVHLASGFTVQAKGRATDIYDGFEAAAARMEKQLRRYKRRLKDHHHKRSEPIDAIGAPSYILEAEADEAEEPASLDPLIIAEMETKVHSLSVGEAVMQMELAGAPLVVFRNESHGGVNVVYRREDGNIGWVDPRNSMS